MKLALLFGGLCATLAAADAQQHTLTYTATKTITQSSTMLGHTTTYVPSTIVTTTGAPELVRTTIYDGTSTVTYSTETHTAFTSVQQLHTVTIPVRQAFAIHI